MNRDLVTAESVKQKLFSIEDLFLSEKEKLFVLKLLSESIRQAHSLSPSGWSVSLARRLIRLNVGGTEVFVFQKEGIFLLLDVPEKIPTKYTEYLSEAEYPSIKGNKLRFDGPVSKLMEMDSLIRPLLRGLIYRASVKKDGEPRKTNYAKGFSSDAIDYMRRILNDDVPYPSFWNGAQEALVTAADVSSGFEGAAYLEQHLSRERKASLVEAKKRAVLEKTGDLACEVCKFSFKKTYGPLGEYYCEVHHLRQIADAGEGVVTKLEDLAVVCSNCHGMIHKSTPMLSISELQAQLEITRTIDRI